MMTICAEEAAGRCVRDRCSPTSGTFDERSPNGASRDNSSPNSGNIRAVRVAATTTTTFSGNVNTIAACGIAAQEQTASSAGSDLLDTPAQLASVLCQVLQSITQMHASAPAVTSPFHSTRAPPMTVRAYVERVVKYSKCSAEALAVSFLLMSHYSVFSGHVINELNVHRLVVTAVLLGAKLRDDEYFSNIYYSRIGGVSAQEMNDLELTMLTTLGWDMWTSEAEFDRLIGMLETARSTPLLDGEATPPHVWQAWWSHMAQAAASRRCLVGKTLADAAAQVLQEQTSRGCYAGLPDRAETPSTQGLSPAKQRRASRGSLSSSRINGFASQNSVGSMADHFPSDPPSSSTPVGQACCYMDPALVGDRTVTPTASVQSPASQQGTPARLLTKQRFPRQTSTPHFANNGGGSNAATPASYGAYAQQHQQNSFPPAPADATAGAAYFYSAQQQPQPSPSTQASSGGKKRSKPEHFADYR
jgi:hypothetical protein